MGKPHLLDVIRISAAGVEERGSSACEVNREVERFQQRRKRILSMVPGQSPKEMVVLYRGLVVFWLH